MSLYTFSMVVEPDANTVTINSVVKERINGAQVARQNGIEWAFLLPYSESDKFEGKICYTNLAARNEISSLFLSCMHVFSL